MSTLEVAKNMKLASPKVAGSSIETRNKALEMVAKALLDNKEEIFAANKLDLEAAADKGISQSVVKRLKFDQGKLDSCIEGINMLINLPDPLGKLLLNRQLDAGLDLYRVTCPIGVIGVIFEARPDALIQISTLCIKSGNCAILKGGKETANSNRTIFNIVKQAVIAAGLPEATLNQAEAHSEIDELLSCDRYVDLIIPRGSNAFVSHIMNNTKIPVMGHADGICHIYVDESFDEVQALKIIVDAKTQYVAACNAVETILVNRKVAVDFLPKLKQALDKSGVKIRGTKEVSEIIPCEVMGEDEFRTEYLDLILSIKLVDGVAEAVDHINYFGSHHTDSIISDVKENVEYFMNMVDSAGVYNNCSTRFADGFRYGFGAEVGISTSKLHARGPVGLEGLVTYKYKLYGQGQIVGDYASGKSQFHHMDR